MTSGSLARFRDPHAHNIGLSAAGDHALALADMRVPQHSRERSST
jgi:hypothetical protein